MSRLVPLAALIGTALCGQDLPASKEAALGAHLANQVRQNTTQFDSPEVRSYVEALGKRLAAHFPADRAAYTFEVLTDPPGGRTFDPIALPGGYVFVSADLLLAARNQAEFAGMLAHAMAHIANQDHARAASQGPVVNTASVPLVFIGGWYGGDSDLPVPSAFREKQRAMEREADATAIQVLSAAGFDPHGLAQYIGRMQASDSQRFTALQQVLARLPDRAYPASDANFASIQTVVRQLTGDTPASPRAAPPSLFPR
jgi:predicted Zn-dependent protease